MIASQKIQKIQDFKTNFEDFTSLIKAMSCKDIKKKPITEIFNAMDFCDKFSTCKFQNRSDSLKSGKSIDSNEMESFSELSHALKVTMESKSFDSAIGAAIKAQNAWKNSTSLKRADSLHKIWKNLGNISKSLSNLGNELLTLMNYFDFYADVAVRTEEYENMRPCGVILIVLSNYSPFFTLGATVPPALAAGCSVIVLVPENVKIVSLFLEEVILAAGLPDGLFNTVAEFRETAPPYSSEIGKIVFCGSYSSAIKWYTRYATIPFSFFCPGNTTAFILDSADLDAAADKIVAERCLRNSVFAVTNVVVQESVSKTFLEKFKYRMKQFMSLNKNSKFRDVISEKVSEASAEALNAGAFVGKYDDFEDEVSQTFTINYQNQDIDEDGTILKVLPCRTAREGVALLNNCRYNLGTSIWSEISSQALEISSMLTCPNIWINSHGVFEAGEPLQPIGFSGNCVLGGSDGVFEYLSFGLGQMSEVNNSSERKRANTEKVNVMQIALSAQSAFSTWRSDKHRRQYLKDIADSLEESKELSKLSETIRWFGHFGNLTISSQRNPQGCLILKRKIPVGVFLLLVNTISIDIKAFATLITALIAFGNSVIVTLKEVNSTVNLLIKNFNNILPKNIIRVIVGIRNGICLASHPNIEAIWIYDESAVSTEFLQTIKGYSATSLKHIWIFPKAVPVSQHLFEKECLRSQVVWLTNVDQFP